MTTEVVHCKRERFDIYIGRTCFGFTDCGLGNPFKVSAHGPATRKLYEDYFFKRIEEDAAFRNLVLKCYGKALG